MLIDEGLIRFENGRWRAARTSTARSCRPTIQALLAARLDYLEHDERAVIEPASVVGQVFVKDAVQVPRAGPRTRQRRGSPRCADGQATRPSRPLAVARGGGVPLSPHPHPRHGVRGDPQARPCTFHEQFVEWADSVNREGATEYEEILGYHLEQAHHYLSELGPLDEKGLALGADGSRRLASAGRRAFARGDMPAAANLLGRAADLRQQNDIERLRLLPMLAEALSETGEFAQSEATLTEALESGSAAGDLVLEADAALTSLLVKHHVTEDLAAWRAEVVTETEHLIPRLEQQQADAELAKAWRLLGFVHATVCHWGEQVAAVHNALEHARRAGDERLEARLTAGFTFGLAKGPTPAPEAIPLCAEIVDRRLADRQADAITRCSLAYLLAMVGDFEQAREQYDTARELLDDLGRPVATAYAAVAAARVELLAEEPGRAEEGLFPAYETLGRFGERYLRPVVGALLAQTLYALGRIEDADRIASETSRIADEDDVETQSELGGLRAKLLAGSGEFDGAAELAQRAVDILRPTDAPVMQANSLVDLAAVLREAGRREHAQAALAEALGLYERKGDVVSSARTITLLAVEPMAADLG